MPIVLIWSGLFMFHHEFADGKKRPTTEESSSPRGPLHVFVAKVGYTTVSVKSWVNQRCRGLNTTQNR